MVENISGVVELHIWLAGLTLVILGIAALQAVLLFIQDRLLHHGPYASRLLQKMPALEKMEKWLFAFILISFILLTVLSLSSLYFFPDSLKPPLLEKTFLAIMTWSLLLILLAGRHWLGWRGRKAISYTLICFIFLVVIYFIS